jgi:hypothetical protein
MKPMASGREDLPEREGISFSPDEFDSGTGLPDDVDATIESVDCVTWAYGGKGQPIPALKVIFKPDGADAFDQFYSAGNLDRLVPADDGSTFYRVGKTSGKMSNSTNAAMFIISMVEQGFPKDKIAAIRGIVGTYGHFARVPQPERPGLMREKKEGDRPKTILVCKAIHKMPWEKEGNTKMVPPASQKTSPAATAKPNGAPAASSDMFNTAVGYAMNVLKKEGAMPIGSLGMAIYSSVGNGAKYRREMIKFVESPEFLENPDLPFTVDTATGLIGL